MSTEAQVVHIVASRCRLRLPHMRGDSVFFERLRHDLAEHAGGAEISVNATTGSVLLSGDGLSIDDIRAFGRDRGWFEIVEPDSTSRVQAGADPVADRIDAKSVRYVLTGLFLTLAAVQVMRGQVLVPATSFLWYALAANALPTDSD